MYPNRLRLLAPAAALVTVSTVPADAPKTHAVANQRTANAAAAHLAITGSPYPALVAGRLAGAAASVESLSFWKQNVYLPSSDFGDVTELCRLLLGVRRLEGVRSEFTFAARDAPGRATIALDRREKSQM